MHLTVLRHGQAVERDEWTGPDADRPLTGRGIERSTLMLRVSRPLIQATEIWTSPWARARATAELAAQAWKLPLREQAWLAGGALSAKDQLARLRSELDVVLVGHEPDLGLLIALLIGASRPIAIKKAGIAVLRGEPRPGEMDLRVLVDPKAVGALIG